MDSARVSVTGHLGADPQLRQVGPRQLAEFSIAVGYLRRQSGKEVEDTDWYRCTLWGNERAPLAVEKLALGDLVNVEGDLRHRKYTHNGRDRVEYEIRVDFWNRLARKNVPGTAEGDADAGSTADEPAATPAAPAEPSANGAAQPESGQPAATPEAQREAPF